MVSKESVLLNPVAEVDLYDAGLAARPQDLNDSCVGLLDNGQPFVGAFLARVEQRLKERYPGIKTQTWRKSYASAPCAHMEEIIEKCDAVVDGIAL
ncbi:MAG: hypothetical protein HYX92_22215 [Chloroflexi bacterium]|nr:hypothetical protein [Chloroflexota bacterium]